MGFVPSDRHVLKCETSIANAVRKLSAAVLVCHAKAAAAHLVPKAFDEEGCETTAMGKYTTAAGRVAALCPPCLDTAAVGDATRTRMDHLMSGLLFCDSASGVLLGDDDDLGWASATTGVLKCEAGAARGVGKAQRAITRCHMKYAAARLNGKLFDEEDCEGTARAKLDNAVAHLPKGCPTCLAGLLTTLPALTEDDVDAANGSIYCASPSGAFVGPEPS